MRALIHIESPLAPERFEFNVDAARLELQDDGSVWAYNSKGVVTGKIESPWAVDAEGRKVPTHFEMNGKTTLVQVVSHKFGNYKYGITADPKWLKKVAGATWDAAKCGAAITAAFTPAGKAFHAIKALGGVKMTIKLIRHATTAADFRRIAGPLAGEILGIAGVEAFCF